MLRGAGAWTTDRAQLDITRSGLGLEPTRDDLAAWESAELLLVTVPKWFGSWRPIRPWRTAALSQIRSPSGRLYMPIEW
jgi:hypothetical protein